ncbi:MAG: hypothetical protein IKP95_02105 [Ruminococcus sp.]|nr:hypothetical protein [Ruminococcus sp.]
MKRLIMNPVTMALLGAGSGAMIRFADYCNPLFEDLSQRVMVWALICILITLNSDNHIQSAVLNICFFVPNLPARYFVWRALSESFGGYTPTPKDLLVGSLLALVAVPPYVFMTEYSKRSGLLPWLSRAGIIILPAVATLIICGNLHWTDGVFAAAMVYIVFYRRTGRFYAP